MSGYSTPLASSLIKKGKKAKPDKSVGEFTGNLFEGIRDALVGVVTSPYYIGRAAYHDVGLGDAKDGSELYAMGSGIVKSMADYYKPLTKGQFSKFGQNVYDNPFQLGLDAATLFTGGGAAAGKIGLKAAESGSKLGAKVAGVERVPYSSLSGERLLRATRPDAQGFSYAPKMRDLITSTGELAYQIPLKRNLVTRGRQQLKEAAFEKYGGSNSPLGRLTNSRMHPDRRGPRMAKKERERIARRERINQLADAKRAAKSLTPEEYAASSRRVLGFRKPHYIEAHIVQRAGLLEELMSDPDAKGNARLISYLKKDLEELSDPNVRRLMEEPSDRMLEVEPLVHDVSDATQVARAARGAEADLDKILTAQSRAAQPLLIAFGAKYSPIHPTERVPTKHAQRADKELVKTAGKRIDKSERELLRLQKQLERTSEKGLERAELMEIQAIRLRSVMSPQEKRQLDMVAKEAATGPGRIGKAADYRERTATQFQQKREREAARLEKKAAQIRANVAAQTDRIIAMQEKAAQKIDTPTRREEKLAERANATKEVKAPDLYGGALPDDISPDERFAVMSMSQARKAKASNKGRTSTSGKRVTGEDLHSTGYAFQHALVKPDLMRIIDSAEGELKHVSAVENLHYIASVAAKVDPTDERQAALVQSGDLVPVLANSDLARQIGEITEFASKIPDPDPATLALLKKWSQDIDGGGLVVPKVMLDELKSQVREASVLRRWLLDMPVQLWRDFTLALKGSYYTNNFLGNMVLGIVAYGPYEYGKSLYRAGSKRSKVGKQIREAAPDQARGQSSILHDTPDIEFFGGRANPANLVHAFGTKLADKLSHVTEENFRAAAIDVELRHAAKTVARNEGITKAEAFNKLLNDETVVDALIQKAAGNMLDYERMTPFEKNVMRTWFPFWSFTRSIVGRSLELTLDTPWKVEVMSMLSQIALAENEEGMFKGLGENLPPYLQGLAAIGDTKGGKTPVISTYAANPFSAAADTGMMAASLITGNKPGEQEISPLAAANPYIKSAIEAATKRDLFFDKQLQGSRGEVYASQLAKSFPQYGFYDRARYPSQSPYVERTVAQAGAQYMGVPVGTFNLANARRNAALAAKYDALDRASLMRQEARRKSRDRGALLGLAS